MKEYLEKHLGKKLGVVRAGFPKEAYFEAEVMEVTGTVAVFKLDDGREVAVSLDKVLLAGTPESEEHSRARPGFL